MKSCAHWNGYENYGARSLLDQPKYSLDNNFMSSNCFYCIELNSHSIILIVRFLRENHLPHLFLPHLFSSQPCESFYRQVRSLTIINLTRVNFSTKELLDRLCRIQLLNEISNDKCTGFVYPKTLISKNVSVPKKFDDFPSDIEIINTIQECKTEAIEKAMKIGQCVTVQLFHIKFHKTRENESSFAEENYDKVHDLYLKLLSASLKNFANKFEEDSLPETSSYCEINGGNRRFVFKKLSICWLLDKKSYKCSSDRTYRVRGTTNKKLQKVCKRKKYLRKMKAKNGIK